MLDIKYPPAKVHDGSDPLVIQLTFDLYHTPKFCRRMGPHQHRSNSSLHLQAPSGLLREPDLAHDFTCRLRPGSYGSRTLPTTPAAGKLCPDSYESRTSPTTSPAGSVRAPTGARLRP